MKKEQLQKLCAKMYVKGFKDGAAYRAYDYPEHLDKELVSAYDAGYATGVKELDDAIERAEFRWETFLETRSEDLQVLADLLEKETNNA